MHPLLSRQLKRLKLSEKDIPSLEQWRQLLERIEKTYNETDQERYLINLATEVSSREAAELNMKLNQTQELACLGLWEFDKATSKFSWSKEMYHLLGVNTDQTIPSIEELKARLSESDCKNLAKLIGRASLFGEPYEYEAKIKNYKGQIRWYRFIGNADIGADGRSERYQSGIVVDITRRKNAEKELHILNQKLIASARLAGMAEIATSVLHNIGNILNSINVSVALVQKSLVESEISDLHKAILMVCENIPGTEQFWNQDPKGKVLPKYIQHAVRTVQMEHDNSLKEIKRLNELVTHIKDIVHTQNTISGVTTIFESISLGEAIDMALVLNQDEFARYNIVVEKNYKFARKLLSDKNMLMQVLINLIQNAKDAVMHTDAPINKKITISAQLSKDKKSVEIIVKDTGIGIDKDDLEKLFTFGFTTKAKGHGIGLHSSFLLTKALGGDIWAESKGQGLGAKFVLALPLNKVPNKKSMNYEKQI